MSKIILLLATFSIANIWAEHIVSYDVGGLTFRYDRDAPKRGACVTGAVGHPSAITIPASEKLPLGEVCSGCDGVHFEDELGEIVDIPIVEVAQEAFRGTGRQDEGLREVVIQGSLVGIGAGAFMENAMLGHVVSYGEIAAIGGNAFQGCHNLTSVVSHKGIGVIGASAFENCSKLIEVDVTGNPPVEVKSHAFLYSALARFPFGEGVKIGDGAFQSCDFVRLELPEGVELGEGAFSYNSALRSVVLPASVRVLPKSTFAYCDNLTDVSVPGGLERIKDSAFCGCRGLPHFDFPERLEYIEKDAFSGCISLTNADFRGTVLKVVEEDAFSGCSALSHGVYFPKTLESLGESAFWQSGIAELQNGGGNGDGTMEFEGLPPVVADNLLAYESKPMLEWFGNRRFYTWLKFPDEYEEAWTNAIAAWRPSHPQAGDWHNLTVKFEVIVEPTKWELNGDEQELELTWHLPTNENRTIEKAVSELKAKNLTYAVWRSGDEPEEYDNFQKSVCLAQNLADVKWLDGKFGDIRGTHPIRYWIEIQDEKSASGTPAKRKRPEAEPVFCTTRRRFGLAIGLSKFSAAAYACEKPDEFSVLTRDTDGFVRQLLASGGVVKSDDVKVIKDDAATFARIGREIRMMPLMDDGKERFAPGDIVFLWMATHGVDIGGIDAYDGYYLSGRDERRDLKPKVDRCATFQDDLAWIRTRPGVRFIGVLPFCHAEWFADDFPDSANVAWICAARKNEYADGADDYAQFAQYFLDYGVSGGLACHAQLLGNPYQNASSFDPPLPRIGNDDDVLTYGELARYAKKLAFGRSSLGFPAHAVLRNEKILDSVAVKDPTVPARLVNPGKIDGYVKEDPSGAIRIYYSNLNDLREILLWFRAKTGPNEICREWNWTRISTLQLKAGGVDQWDQTWTMLTNLMRMKLVFLPSNCVLFGTQTKVEWDNVGPVLPDCEYEFAIQCANENGFGPVNYLSSCKTGKNLPTAARDVFEVMLRESIRYNGAIFSSEVAQVCPISVEIEPGNDGWNVCAYVGEGEEAVRYEGMVAAAEFPNDGTLSVVCRRTAEKRLLGAGETPLDELQLTIDANGVSGLFGDSFVVAVREGDADLISSPSAVCPGDSVWIDPLPTSVTGAVKYSAKGLPKGLSINATTGVISGTPTEPGQYVVRVTATSVANRKQSETFDVPLIVGNYVDSSLPELQDSYGPYVPGVAVEENFRFAQTWNVKGLPPGLKIVKGVLSGVPTKPGTNTVYFTRKDTSEKPAVEHKASSTFVVGPLPKLSVMTFGNGTGKVSGTGAFAANKKVTLKATADSKSAAATAKKTATVKSAFAGWYDGEMNLLSRAASYSFPMPASDVTYLAKFVTSDEDVASISAVVNGHAFVVSGGETPPPLATNVMAGVYLAWPVAASALSETTVKVAGLPSGLKFTAKPVTTKVTSGTGKSKVTTVVTNVPPNTIYGAPTAASKNDKKGNVTPSKVKVTVTTAGKSKAVYEIALTVDPLPALAQGEFSGLASTPEGRLGSASMSVTAAGKVSGKVIVNGTNVSFTAASYDITSKTVGETNLVAVVTGKLGKETVTGGITVVASGASGTFAGPELVLFRNMWKDKGAEPVPADAQGLYTVKLDAGDRGTGYLSLTVDKKGAVKVAGKAPDGTALSASVTLVPAVDPEGAAYYFADVFCAPSVYKGGYVAGRLSWDVVGQVSSDGLDWTSFNPQSTTNYYDYGFSRGLSVSGARYMKADAPKKLTVADIRLEKPEGAELKTFSFTQSTGIWKGTLLWDFGDSLLDPVKVPFEGIMVQGEDLEGFGTYDVPASYVPIDKNGKPQKQKTYKVKESLPVRFGRE